MGRRKRIDPVSRPADGRSAMDIVLNRDPERHYVYANPNDDDTGVEAYLGMGYEVETARPDGPRSAVRRTLAEGKAVTVRSQILMSRPLDEHLVEYHEGQAKADMMDRRILKDDIVEQDGLRGQNVRLGVDRANTSAPVVWDTIEPEGP